VTNRVEIAEISERVEATTAGRVATVFLVLNTVVWLLAFILDSSAVRAASYGTMLTGGNVLFGLAVALGRRRTYIVTRENPPPR
jgi:hypothetical protein